MDVLLIVGIAGVWLGLCVLFVCVCASAKEGDAEREPSPADTARRRHPGRASALS